jgi:hypothetical protein
VENRELEFRSELRRRREDREKIGNNMLKRYQNIEEYSSIDISIEAG